MSQNSQLSNSQKVYQVVQSDLPIHCPTDEMSLWSAHPRVFLPLNKEHPEIHCPYCGTKFVLKDEL